MSEKNENEGKISIFEIGVFPEGTSHEEMSRKAVEHAEETMEVIGAEAFTTRDSHGNIICRSTRRGAEIAQETRSQFSMSDLGDKYNKIFRGERQLTD